MTCQHCGKEIEDGSQFCLYCGQKVEVTYKCVSCGSVIHEGDTFCMSCGWKVNMSEIAAKAAEEEEKRKEAEIAAAKAKKKNPIVWIILGLVVVGGIIAAVFFGGNNESNDSSTQIVEMNNDEIVSDVNEEASSEDEIDEDYGFANFFSFTGDIDNHYPISGELSWGDACGYGGWYYYDKYGSDNKLALVDFEFDEGSVTIIERNKEGKQTGKFFITYIDEGMTYMRGTYTVKKTGEEMPVELQLTKINEMSEEFYVEPSENEENDRKPIVKDDSWINDHSKWVDMGVKSDNGQTLLWATSDFSIDENGAPYLTIYGQKGKTFLWGDIWGDENATMTQNPQMNICGNPEYDIVTAHFGAPARLPSYKEIQSLCDNCTERFVSLDVDVPEFFANNIPSWILGQWMRSTNVNGKAISETIKFDGLLASVLLTQGGKNESTYNGFYTFDGSSIYVNGICYTLDFENQTITAPDGERLRHISTESSIGKAYGCLLTSKINGNKLLLAYQPPVAAASNGSVSVSFRPKQEVYYWSGSVYDQDTDIAYLLGVIKGDGWGLMGKERNLRFCIRPVMEN